MDAAAPPASHLEYKLISCSKAREEEDNYRCEQLNNHSITSGSSNHTELIRAYEFGRRFHAHHHHDEQQQKVFYYDEEEDDYTNNASNASIMSDETPTDPGIRRFTKSPPRPNETRTAHVACFAGSLKINNHDSAEDEDDDDDEDDEEPESAQVEDVGDSDSESVLTASPASSCSEPDLSSPSTPTNDQQPADVFAAIPRNRSRHPSWAQSRMTHMYKQEQQRTSRIRTELDLVREKEEGLSSDKESIDRVHKERKRGIREEPSSSRIRARKKSLGDAKKVLNPLVCRSTSSSQNHPPSSSSSSSHHHLALSSSLAPHPSSSSSPSHLLSRTVTHLESTGTSGSSSQAAGGVAFPPRKLYSFLLLSFRSFFFFSLSPVSFSLLLCFPFDSCVCESIES